MPGNWRTRSWAATHEVSVSRQRSPIFLRDYTPEDASRVDFLMTTAVIVGSGAAAAGAALALSTRPDIQITVLDLGARLEPEKQHVLDRLSVLDQEHWPDVEMASVVGQPVRSSVKGLPEKRTLGSDFPFRDVGQLGSGAEMSFRTSELRRLGGFDVALGGGTPSRGGEDLASFGSTS